jgi:hypothetical protein
MKVGIIQSNYIPWRGYFDFIDDVDLFVVLDDVQYSKGSWRNRNQIKVPNGLSWLTVPVIYQNLAKLIQETQIDHSKKWQVSHLNKFTAHYAEAPFVEVALAILQEGLAHADQTISELNVRLIRHICTYLEITTPLILSQDLQVSGVKTDRILQILQRVGATTYLSGPAARAYLDEGLLRSHGIQLEYKTYQYNPYPQLHGDFVPTVTILDLIANVGAAAKNYLKSTVPNEAVG